MQQFVSFKDMMENAVGAISVGDEVLVCLPESSAMNERERLAARLLNHADFHQGHVRQYVIESLGLIDGEQWYALGCLCICPKKWLKKI